VTIGAAVVAAAFAPWAIAVWIGAHDMAAPLANVDWISVPSWPDVPRFYDALVARVLTPAMAWIGAGVIVVPLLALAVRRLRASSAAPERSPGAQEPGRPASGPLPPGAAGLAWFALAPVLAVFALSVTLSRSAFVPRYLLVAAPAWWLLIGIAMTGADDHRRSRARRLAAAAAFAAFTLAAGAAREVRGGEKIRWDAAVRTIAADAGPAGGTIYSLEGFTALPAAYYAATLETRLAVRPVRDLAAIAPPAWLVVRSAAGQRAATLGAALQVRGRKLTEIFVDSVPSHVISIYRIGAP
ncbi:MAG TPA: hypothetical protein VG916_14200, partial [Gemmatimonadaceae bacterium]|nr:hypothetical protein [Gemmatimonadaceae bacterium]